MQRFVNNIRLNLMRRTVLIDRFTELLRSTSLKTFGFIIVAMLSSNPASACSWAPADQITSEFISDKILFWGMTTELKWDKNPKLTGTAERPNKYYEVEVIKPLRGKVGKTVKVWTESDTCGASFNLGEIELFVVKRNDKRDYYGDGFLSNAASHTAIISYLKEGIDTHTSALPFISTYGRGFREWDYISYKEECLPGNRSDTVDQDSRCIELSLAQKMQGIYESEYSEVKALSNRKPWWQFGRN